MKKGGEREGRGRKKGGKKKGRNKLQNGDYTHSIGSALSRGKASLFRVLVLLVFYKSKFSLNENSPRTEKKWKRT